MDNKLIFKLVLFMVFIGLFLDAVNFFMGFEKAVFIGLAMVIMFNLLFSEIQLELIR